ncbi:EF-hand domain-containing protein [Sphingomonas mesophila]|uniref:EF-hand domain-containing protein n=1 Tax=Sphingomonas mesophila TaxID=2303576 RepID=UPI000E569C52|nr:EF-hand domain-containing protein [Sphingomonas mesophila]
MLAATLALLLQSAAPATPASAPSGAPFNPRANDLFQADPVLRGWAVRQYDSNRDGWLTLYEAQPALAAFREIADGDRDGRITTAEYRRAKEYIAARW